MVSGLLTFRVLAPLYLLTGRINGEPIEAPQKDPSLGDSSDTLFTIQKCDSGD